MHVLSTYQAALLINTAMRKLGYGEEYAGEEKKNGNRSLKSQEKQNKKKEEEAGANDRHCRSDKEEEEGVDTLKCGVDALHIEVGSSTWSSGSSSCEESGSNNGSSSGGSSGSSRGGGGSSDLSRVHEGEARGVPKGLEDGMFETSDFQDEKKVTLIGGKRKRMIDIGAGTGYATDQLRPLCEDVVATEVRVYS